MNGEQQSLQQLARALGGSRPAGGGPWSWDELTDLAVVRYWQQRPNIRPACGSEPGYRAHLLLAERTCQPCRDAHAAITAIRRLRRGRGIRTGRPALAACGTHAAYVRHRARRETPCLACVLGERLYQASRYRSRRAGAA